MKKLLFAISLVLHASTSFGQVSWDLYFDSNYNLDRVYNDTASNPNCIWQIGQPSKSVFTSSFSFPNSIVTDTINPVPANDTSTFYLIHIKDHYPAPHVFGLLFWYQMDGDSTDFGTIEVSPDSGLTWINLLTQDTVYFFEWQTPKPTLKGSTNGWEEFNVDLSVFASLWPTPPLYLMGDTILFRFTYVTDSLSAPHDGWVIDNFLIVDSPLAIDEIQMDNLISIYPNPTSDELRIRKTVAGGKSGIQVLDYTGKVLYSNPNFIGESFDTRYLPNGVYLLKYTNDNSFSIKRFVVQR